jgi:adenylate cyclase
MEGLDESELERLGIYDPRDPDAASRLELVRYVLSSGASLEDIAAAANLGELALDHNLRPERPFTLGGVVKEGGYDWAVMRRLLVAVGLPTDPQEPMTADEAATVRLLAGASQDLLGEAATVQLARVTGGAMARLAETLVGVFRLQFELPRRAAGKAYVDVVKEYSDSAQTLLPAFVQTLDALLRRQIIAVAERMWSTDEERSVVTLPRTVGFADLVGYTTAAAAMSARELTTVLVEFDEVTAEIVLRGGGQVVKTIGDEAMFVTEDAADACNIALELVSAFGQGSLPPVRVGLARGEVVSMLGDVFGPEVNLAARLVGATDPATVLVSEEVRTAVGDAMGFEPVAPLSLKGIAAPVTAYRLLG